MPDKIVSVNILTLPSDGGAPITDIEYRVNEGAAISLGETTTGSYEITADEGDDVQIRAVNAIGAGDWSDTKVVGPDPDAAAYIAAVEAEDGEALEPAIAAAYDAFVKGCKQDGIFEAIKASCIMAGARTLSGALVPLAGPAPTNFNFVPADYDRVTGLKGDGSTKYLDSNRNNNADPQNSKHLAVFSSSPTFSGDFTILAGSSFTIGHSQILYVQSEDRFGIRINGDGSAIKFPGAGVGLIGGSRSDETNIDAISGSIKDTFAQPSAPPEDEKIYIFWRGIESGDRHAENLSFYSIGEAIDLAALDARVTALMTAIEDALT